MHHVRAVQPRLRAWVAATLATLLVAAGLSLAAPAAHAEVAAPAVTVTPAAGIDPSVETTLTIHGTGFVGAGAANGVYVNVGTADQWTPGTMPSAGGWIVSGWVMLMQLVDGEFTTTLVVPAGALEATGAYGVATFAAHALSATDRTLDTFTPIALAAPEPEPEPDPVANPVVDVTPAAGIDPSVETTLTIHGTGFVGAGAANGVYVNVGTADQWTPGTVPSAGGWIVSGWVMPMQLVDGEFTTTLVVPAGALEATGSYGIATFAAHALSATDRTLDTFTPIALTASGPTITVSKATGLDPLGEVITVTGTGFVPAPPSTDGTRPPLRDTFSGVYVAFGKYPEDWKPSESAPSSARVNASATWFVHEADLPRIGGTARGGAVLNADGSFTVDIRVAPGFENEPESGEYGIYTYAGGGAIHAPFETATLLSFASATPTTPPVTQPAPVPTSAGSLTWGIKESFRSYILNPAIADGRIELSGVGSAGGSFVFGQAEGGTYTVASGTGTSHYSGSVRFWGHHGELDVTFANPTVSIDSATRGTLYVTSNGSRIALASLDLSAGTVSSSGGSVAYRGVPASLTSAGNAVFAIDGAPIYPTGTALDPVSFVIGAPSTGGGTSVLTAEQSVPGPAATPPATTGIELLPGSHVRPGGVITITAGGFEPNETGILVVLYSTPTVLDRNAIADADGVVTWTGVLPEGVAGQHTLTLQGSVSRGIELDIPATVRTAAVQGCAVTDGELSWGFKEAFRSYISGAIANGEWTVADGAEYETPLFGFTGGEGSYDPSTGEGIIGFAGSIRFTGHGGILDTTVANPQVRLLDHERGLLLLDVTGETQQGVQVQENAVEFADLDLTVATIADDGGTLTIDGAAVTLTEAGAAAFGTYGAGEQFDDLTVSFAAADCELIPDAPGSTDAGERTGAAADLGWLAWAIPAGVLVLAAIAVVVFLVRRAPQ